MSTSLLQHIMCDFKLIYVCLLNDGTAHTLFNIISIAETWEWNGQF
jgi:hypothetical protein